MMREYLKTLPYPSERTRLEVLRYGISIPRSLGIGATCDTLALLDAR